MDGSDGGEGVSVSAATVLSFEKNLTKDLEQICITPFHPEGVGLKGSSCRPERSAAGGGRSSCLRDPTTSRRVSPTSLEARRSKSMLFFKVREVVAGSERE